MSMREFLSTKNSSSGLSLDTNSLNKPRVLASALESIRAPSLNAAYSKIPSTLDSNSLKGVVTI